MSSPLAIVLAAGKGTRMESELPKVLVPVLGRPMIRYVLDALRTAGVEQIRVVVGYRGDLVRQELEHEPGIQFVEQTELLGTGHAVMSCREHLASHAGPVLVLAGDSPMAQARSLVALLDAFRKRRPACLIGTATKPDPTGLGRIVRDSAGEFVKIVEEKDATSEERAITEVNMSTYLFDSAHLLTALDALTTNNQQGEYYLTDCPGILLGRGARICVLKALQPCESLSINTRDELQLVEEELRRQRAAPHDQA